MMLAVEVPAQFSDEHPLGAVATAGGEALAGVADCPASAWGRSIRHRRRPRWRSWRAGRRTATSRSSFEVSHALRESLTVAQRRVHRAVRLRRFLPAFKAAFTRGELSELDVEMLVRATNGCDDPQLLAKVQQRTLANRANKTAHELRAYARKVHRGVDSYRPTAEQVAHVRAAYPTSVGLGSHIRADRCDTDHAVEWPDGVTMVTNLAPWDRSWHNRKTRGSLHVSIDDSGAVTVTTVLGQSRTVTPYD